MVLVSDLLGLIRNLIGPRTSLVAENLALRQQLAILNQKIHRAQLHRRDRFFWVILSQLWKNWREVLIIVKPETVIRWHGQGFKLSWRWKSKAPVGRPKIDREIRELIKRMSLEIIGEWALHRQDGIFGTDKWNEPSRCSVFTTG